MFEKLKLWFILTVVVALLIYLLPFQNIYIYFKYMIYKKHDLNINLALVNEQVKALSADPSNKLILKAEVKNNLSEPVQNANIVFTVKDKIGEVYPSAAKTDKYGECFVTYIPPTYNNEQLKNGPVNVAITTGVDKLNINSTINIQLVGTPVIFVHGYRADGRIFDNLNEYLTSKGFTANTVNYNSADGVVSSAEELNSYIQQQKRFYLSKNIQVKQFDLITHSMGGLVARYYTCSSTYISNSDVRKLIFLSVPQHGSHLASLGKNYYNDQGIMDLIPESDLYSKGFPSMINKGLNNAIQTGSILGEYDEVVGTESASLEEWNIKTEIFNVGESNFTMDNLLNGNIIEAANHKAILNNRKVFERIESMLNSKLPFPSVKKQ